MYLERTRKALIALSAALIALSFSGCPSSGNTDGGSNAEAVGDTGSVFVSDGALGSNLSIRVTSTLTVGGQAGFAVTATDASGAGIPFIRIVCDSEEGVAILEPSSNGIALESTGPDGVMSGVLGGNANGSYMLECRGPAGFNLVSRIRIDVQGDIPEGFAPFSAAGENLGGGLTENNEIGDVRITSMLFPDAPTDTDNQIDGVFTSDCDTSDTNTDDPEAFYNVNYNVNVANPLSQRITIRSIVFVIGGTASTGTFSVQQEIEDGGTGVISGLFIDRISGAPGTYAGSTDTASLGSFSVEATVTGVTDSGESFTLTGETQIFITSIDRCGS